MKPSRSCLLLHRQLVVAALLAGLAFVSAAHGAAWRTLFNGRDLTGWTVINGSAPYTVMDGAIVGSTVAGSPNSFLAHEEMFGDFVLELEVKQEVAPTNSGVQFRSISRPDVMDGRVHGTQCEIDPSARAYTGGIYDEARRGWLYPLSLNPPARSVYQYGRWNQIRIEAIGNSIRTWVNGVPAAHVIDDLTPSGLIALQVHSVKDASESGRRVLWRNIRIQTTDLHPAPADDIFVRSTLVNQVTDVERAQGWRLLWDGKTTAGWRGAHRTAFPRGRVEDRKR